MIQFIGNQQYGNPQYGDQGPGNMGWNQQQQFPGQQFLNDPMASMAMQYGTSLAGQGKDLVNKNVDDKTFYTSPNNLSL